jgi:CBS domain-containing protein
MSTGLVSEVMCTEVVAVKPTCGYRRLVDVFDDLAVGAVPVVDERDHVLGVVSESDVLHANLVGLTGAETAGTLMRAPAVSVSQSAPIREAARLMDSRHVRWLPVLDASEALVGAVSRRDLLRRWLRRDATIARDVSDALRQQALWLDPTMIQVRVVDGVVTLSGTAERRTAARLAVRVARAIDGVHDVVTDIRVTG